MIAQNFGTLLRYMVTDILFLVLKIVANWMFLIGLERPWVSYYIVGLTTYWPKQYLIGTLGN